MDIQFILDQKKNFKKTLVVNIQSGIAISAWRVT